MSGHGQRASSGGRRAAGEGRRKNRQRDRGTGELQGGIWRGVNEDKILWGNFGSDKELTV
jgi:hypothetical protein